MKLCIWIFALFMSSSINAHSLESVPEDLLNLIPQGETSIVLNGVSDTGIPCWSKISTENDSFSIVVTLEKDFPNQTNTLQLLLNSSSELNYFKKEDGVIQATATLHFDDQYSMPKVHRLKIYSDRYSINYIELTNVSFAPELNLRFRCDFSY